MALWTCNHLQYNHAETNSANAFNRELRGLVEKMLKWLVRRFDSCRAHIRTLSLPAINLARRLVVREQLIILEKMLRYCI